MPHIDLRENCTEVIGKDTISAMHSGVIFGMASLMDGMAQRYRKFLGNDTILIATGGLSDLIVPHCMENFISNKNLVSEGLYMIYKMNKQDNNFYLVILYKWVLQFLLVINNNNIL